MKRRRLLLLRPDLSLASSPLGAAALALLAAVVAVTLVGLVLLWPDKIARPRDLVTTKTLEAQVVSVQTVPCSVELAAGAGCRVAAVKLLEGPQRGTTTQLQLVGASGAADAQAGDRIRVFKTPPPPPGTPTTERLAPYQFADFDRRAPMVWLGIAFAVLLLLTGRFHGLRALVGLGASLAILLKFVIPSILSGHSPLAVALVGALAVLLVTIPTSYGLGAKAVAAWLGTAISLLLALELASVFTRLAHLTGASSEDAVFLSATTAKVSLHGLLLAGMVVGALGVLADLTVSQASTVIALRRVDPRQGFGRLFRGALDVGHDHIAATVNTLVFAYAGAALPVLLIFSIGGTPFTDAINNEAVAEEIVATLIGSIALIASMPVTTALAALLAARLPFPALAADAHAGHAH